MQAIQKYVLRNVHYGMSRDGMLKRIQESRLQRGLCILNQHLGHHLQQSVDPDKKCQHG
jgi:hypothetical protein